MDAGDAYNQNVTEEATSINLGRDATASKETKNDADITNADATNSVKQIVVVVGKRRVEICKVIRTRWRLLFVLSINNRSPVRLLK